MQHQSERVLFIDDDSPVRNAFVRSLRRHGFDIDVADGAAGALHLLESSQYAVIATDYRMPEVDGLELIEQMRHVQPDATYMLVSGECDLELCLEAVNDHAVSYVIPKPWDTDELATALRRSMETHWEKVTQREMQRSAVNHSRTLDIQKIKLDDALQKSEETFGELLLNALTIRGHETLAHCRRVAAYAEMLALQMGLRGHILVSIKQGAMLHDIGKIGVPDAILLKAGALDAEEWQVMRQHVETGARLLEGLGVLDGAREIVLQHHERWDGSGYPRALAADQICVGARIFAVADALDAMLSDRPYRDGMGVQAAVLEIKQCSGSHFDPQVVQAFLKIPLEKWIDVRLQFPEAGGSAQRHSVAG